MIRDPRSDAEKARADLVRNSELGMAVPESPIEREPSATPQTFGDTSQRARDQVAQEGLEAGGVAPEQDDGDSTGTGTIPSRGPAPVRPTESDRIDPEDAAVLSPVRRPEDDDVLSRAKE